MDVVRKEDTVLDMEWVNAAKHRKHAHLLRSKFRIIKGQKYERTINQIIRKFQINR